MSDDKTRRDARRAGGANGTGGGIGAGGDAPDASAGGDAPDAAATEVVGAVEATEQPGAAETTGGARPTRSVWGRLYHGETSADFVGRRRLWFGLSALVLVIGMGAFGIRGLNLGIEFEGGVVWQVPAGDATVAEMRDAVRPLGLAGSTIQELESDAGREIRVEAEPLPPERSDEVSNVVAEVTGSSFDQVDLTEVGPSWGEEISEQALRALVVFLVLVTIYIAVRFELKMAIGTLVALLHDLLVTVGVYAVTQLEVTPATVIAVLTVLGYSIYDGVVVFDKVDENTRRVSSTGGLSYGGMVNLSLNQALMRSLNTNITAVLPVASLLVVGSWILGARTLEEFAVALLVGLLSGAYSSLFIASPVLAVLKEREPRYREIRDRVRAGGGDAAVVRAMILGESPRGARTAATTAGRATSPETAGAAAGSSPPVTGPSGRPIPPRPRKKTKGRR